MPGSSASETPRSASTPVAPRPPTVRLRDGLGDRRGRPRPSSYVSCPRRDGRRVLKNLAGLWRHRALARRPRRAGAEGPLSRQRPRLLLVAPEPAPDARGLHGRLRRSSSRAGPLDVAVRDLPFLRPPAVELAVVVPDGRGRVAHDARGAPEEDPLPGRGAACSWRSSRRESTSSSPCPSSSPASSLGGLGVFGPSVPLGWPARSGRAALRPRRASSSQASDSSSRRSRSTFAT